MNAITKATSIAMIPMKHLIIAPENPRSEASPEKVAELAENIAIHGIIDPLSAYKEKKSYYVVAGGRRVRALHTLLANEIIDDNYLAPVLVFDKSEARDIGIVDQLTHVAMTKLDELRVFQHDKYKNATHAELAKIIGKSATYVAKQRKILELPQEVIDALFADEIDMSQAIGLTYFLDTPETLMELFDDLKACPHRYDADDLRDHANFTTWESNRLAEVISQEAYIKAGGKLQEDLFAGESIILSPHILNELAHEHAVEAAQAKAEELGASFVRELSLEENYYWSLDTHRGMDNLTDEERDEWDDIRYCEWQHDRDEDEEWFARFDELKEKSKKFYPDELKAMLGFVWQFSPHRSDQDFMNSRENVLPDDLEPFYEKGYLFRPAEDPVVPEGEEVPEGPALSNALVTLITQLETHVRRMELSKNPNLVIEKYLVHVQTGNSYNAAFTHVPDHAFHLPNDFPAAYSRSWEAMMGFDKSGADGVLALNAAEQRKLLAFKMLNCLTTHHNIFDITPKMIRTYWAPDQEFMNRYSKDVLVKMAKDDFAGILDVGNYKTKKALAEALAAVGTKEPEWLPNGFSCVIV